MTQPASVAPRSSYGGAFLALVPRFVVVIEAGVDCGEYHLDPLEGTSVEAAGPRRRHEFAAGRSCARRALAALGAEPTAVPRSATGEPLWPNCVVGSITHGAGRAAAAVAWGRSAAALGIDIERHPAVPDAAVGLVCTPAERAWLAERNDSGVHWLTVIFSAKEAAGKAWAPIVGRRLRFDEVHLEVDGEGQRVVATCTAHSTLPVMSIRFDVSAGAVRCLAIAEP